MGLMKNCVKALDQSGKAFLYLRIKFPDLSDDIVIKQGIFVSLQTRKVIRRKNQQYALIVSSFIYFYVLAPTCFGSSLPSSGSLLDPPELLEKHN
jgi:hypothetical protein